MDPEVVLLAEELEIAVNIPLLDLSEILDLEPIYNEDEGSITPTTKRDKFKLNAAAIDPNIVNEYNNKIKDKRNEVLETLGKNIETCKKKITVCRGVISVFDNTNRFYKDVEKELNSLERQLESYQFNFAKITEAKILNINEKIFNYAFITIYQQNIHDELNENTPMVYHYGLNNNEFAREMEGCYIENGILHPFEEILFKNAFDYLNNTESSETYIKNKALDKPYPKNTVLVDIFDRSTNLINAGHNRCHTVALWKSKDNVIVIIDPSKTSYSSHILDSLKEITNLELKTVSAETIYGVAIYNKETGYSDYDDTEPKARDCVDIAIKIAFELNEQQKTCKNIQEIENNMLNNISNQLGKARYLTHFINIVIRELHSSDKDVREQARETIEKANENITLLQLKGKDIINIKNFQEIIEFNKNMEELKKLVNFKIK